MGRHPQMPLRTELSPCPKVSTLSPESQDPTWRGMPGHWPQSHCFPETAAGLSDALSEGMFCDHQGLLAWLKILLIRIG